MPLRPPITSWFDRYPRRTFLLFSGVLVLLLYWRSFSSPFVYDDLDQIVRNPNLGVWSDFVHRFLLQPVSMNISFLGYKASSYRPLFWLSIFFDRSVWGLNASAFHTTNIALHLLNGNLAFSLLRRLKMPVLGAAITSLLWLSLPINTEAVAWVSGRAYLLCILFILLSLLSALSYMRQKSALWIAASGVTAACAMLSHELGVVVLPLLFVVTYVAKPEWSKGLLGIFGVVILAGCGVEAVRFSIGVKSFSGLATPAWAGLAFWEYLRLAIVPVHMSVERSTTISLSQPHPWLVIELACSIAVVAAAILYRKKNPALGSIFLGGLLWFALCVAPFCLVMNYQGIAERFDYAASLGIALAIVVACSLAPQPHLRKGLILCAAAWSLWNLYRTSVRVADWSDPVRLYTSSLQATPLSPLIHYNLAVCLRERGDLQGALAEYQRTLEIDRHYPNGLAALGDVYLDLKSFTTAQTIYQQALMQNPNDTAVLLNSGAAYQGSGESANAEAVYQRILQINPQSSDAHVNLGVLYSSERRQTDAMHQFAMAIDLKTKDITPYYDLAVLFQQAGRGDLALALYKKVLELKPDDEDTLKNIRILQAQAAPMQ